MGTAVCGLAFTQATSSFTFMAGTFGFTRRTCGDTRPATPAKVARRIETELVEQARITTSVLLITRMV
jgi:hypothetical protein